MEKVMVLSDVGEITPIISALQGALLNRPDQDEGYECDPEEALACCDECLNHFRELEEVREPFFGGELLEAAEGLAIDHRRLWEMPFPPDLETPRLLVSAVLEKSMRNILRVLQSVAASGSEELPGYFRFDLGGEDEMERFAEWQEGGGSLEYTGKRDERKEFGCLAMIAAFLLGGWLWRRR